MRQAALLLFLMLMAGGGLAQPVLRIATFNVGLGRDGPGLLIKDIADQDADIAALVAIIVEMSPDIVLLTGFDVDYRQIAIGAFQQALARAGLDLPYRFAPIGNAGVASGLDLNGNGRMEDWADNRGFGRFEGNKSIALLSRLVIDQENIRRFNRFLWRDLPGAIRPGGAGFLSDEAWNGMPLSSRGHYDVPVVVPGGGELHLLLSYPTPPVFDGPEDLNGLRNDAEIRFWVEYLNGARLGDDAGNDAVFGESSFVLLGDLNADPKGGEGIGRALAALLAHPLLQDPLPDQATVVWPDTGPLRVDYVLPSVSLTVVGAGVYNSAADAELLTQAATAHRLVWVDINVEN